MPNCILLDIRSKLQSRALLVSTVYQDLIHIKSVHILLTYSSHHPLVQKIQNQVLSIHLSGYQNVFCFMPSLHNKAVNIAVKNALQINVQLLVEFSVMMYIHNISALFSHIGEISESAHRTTN